MARAIFVVTVLVALCCTSQAFPPEKSEKWDNVIKELEERIKDMPSKTTTFANQPYILRKLGEVWAITDQALDSAQKIVDHTNNAVQDILGSVRKGGDKIMPNNNTKEKKTNPTEEAQVASVIHGIQDEFNNMINGIKNSLRNIKKNTEEGMRNIKEHINDDLEKLKNI